ncbi:fungal zn binuclear cluster domain containing [Trichoderma arundinaceum]|uniref:Fungal zn binuclear cluster domain containing n=1 Tax=Trichoderma arundinaceum TaxID=490622 RepID=A0A395NCQ7_TRIAR|nr:fungal zn binuclear cluster domain containing [Trichoderma arundinaceum]
MASSIRGNPTHVLKRSFSTPSVGGATPTSYLESQSFAPQMGEKKRNKLGYHRTSIACGHCRRRKIRCIISSEDQNRCVNCIRLKKECSFHPVDQQQPYDQKLPPQTPTPGGSNVVTASSSPAISRGSSVDQGSQRQHYPAMPVASVPSMGTPTIQTPQNEYFPPDMEGGLPEEFFFPSNAIPPGPSYGMGEPSSTGWMTTERDTSTVAKVRDPSIWRSYPGEVPMSLGGQLSPYADPATPSAAWPPNSTFGSASQMGWNSSMPPPPRSMSFSGEVLGSQHTPQYYPSPQQNQMYERPSQHFTHVYGGVPVGETDEGIEQAIDPAIMGAAVPSAAPMGWQQPQAPQQPQQQQQLMSQHQQHQMSNTQGAGGYRGWTEYGEGDGAHHM